MKNKKLVLIIVILAVVGLISGGIFYYLNSEDNKTSLSLLDRQWIESNKDSVVDLSIFTGVNVLSNNGTGVIFDFLEDLNKDTNLTFNNVAYQVLEEARTDYSFRIVDNVADNQLLLHKDNAVLVSTSDNNYSNISEIKNVKIGTLKNYKTKLELYLSTCDNVTYEEYETYDELIEKLNDKTINMLVLPKLIYMDKIISGQNLFIVYNLTDISNNYVLNLGNNEKLNKIIIKYFQNWKSTNFERLYNKYMYSNIATNLKLEEKEKVAFKSKTYTYGYVINLPFDTIVDGNIIGINKSILEKFSLSTGVEFVYKKYNSYEELKNAFNDKKIDLFYNTYFNDTYQIENVFLEYNSNEKAVVLTNKNMIVNSIKSLIGNEVLTIKNTILSSELQELGIKVKEYNNIDDLLKNGDGNIIVIDSELYNYYISKNSLKYKNIFSYQMNSDYGFVVNSDDNNKIFIKLFNEYLKVTSSEDLTTLGYNEIIDVKVVPIIIKYVSIALALLISLCLIFYLILRFIHSRKKKDKIFTKEDKLRYIDMLTSLKNRNYLNDNLERWDNSEIYPQAIIIIDLNNIAYINDNYGHEEGDKIIGEAANILIRTQMTNTDIIRTNGNEFLVYMVSYDEKQVITYTKKLAKEFKELSHKFGAAVGYSMILDGIKTIDDAINEATLDMKSNKEEINN